MRMKCFLCSTKLDLGYLCKAHAEELKRMLDLKINLIEKPEWKHHCDLCGEYKHRKMVEYGSYAYFCDKDILEEWGIYHPTPSQ